MDKMYTITDEHGDAHDMSRYHFQVLHSAGRTLLRQAVQTYNHSPEASAFLVALDEAVTVGHEVLGTERVAADEYIRLVNGISEAQREHAREILEKEGLLTKGE
jgi:hypothetical protein